MALAPHPEDQCNTKWAAGLLHSPSRVYGLCYLSRVARDGYPRHHQLLDQQILLFFLQKQLLLFVLLYHKDDCRRRRRLQW
jgi:hypothetical protein